MASNVVEISKWQIAARKRLMVLSATQFETYELCPRKWWFEKVRKLPYPDTGATIFGTVLHAVIERYLKGDKQGRNADGTPIDLYPHGWTKAMNRYTPGKVDGEVSGGEQEIIKTLVTKAIEAGVLECFDDREIEYEFRETLSKQPCPTCKGIPPDKTPCGICGAGFGRDHDLQVHELAAAKYKGDDTNKLKSIIDPAPWMCPTCGGDGIGVHIQITGFIDYMTADGIQDHKSVKRMEYAKSKEKLRDNIQMLIGAEILIEKYRKEGVSPPAKINIRHNVYCKDPNDLRVRKTEIFVTPEEVEANWSKIKEMSLEMARLRAHAKSWHDTPDPKSFASACNAYGGCRFRPICGGQETESAYELQRGGGLDNNLNTVHNTTNGNASKINETFSMENQMGIADKIRAQGQATTAMPPGGGVNPPASAPVQAPGPFTPPPAAAPANIVQTQTAGLAAAKTGVKDAVPWANPDCTSCRGLGMNTAGSPCRICDLRAPGFNKKPSSEYALEVMGDGTIYWKDKATGADGLSPMRLEDAGALPVKTEEKVEVVPVVQQQAAAPAPTPVQTTDTAAAPDTSPKKRGRGPNKIKAAGSAPDAPPIASTGSGLILIIGSTTNIPGAVMIGDLFRETISGLAAAGIEAGQLAAGRTFYDLDPFRRRDMLMESGESIAFNLGDMFVVVDRVQCDPDMRALVDALRPFASGGIVQAVSA